METEIKPDNPLWPVVAFYAQIAADRDDEILCLRKQLRSARSAATEFDNEVASTLKDKP